MSDHQSHSRDRQTMTTAVVAPPTVAPLAPPVSDQRSSPSSSYAAANAASSLAAASSSVTPVGRSNKTSSKSPKGDGSAQKSSQQGSKRTPPS